jgi:hypothetical protein
MNTKDKVIMLGLAEYEAEIYITLEDLALNNKVLNVIDLEYLTGNIDGRYNCWGFTAFSMGWDYELAWWGAKEMNALLETHSEKVDIPRKGDIAVYRDTFCNELMHTAIVISNEYCGSGDPMDPMIIHKPGMHRLEITWAEHTRKGYNVFTTGRCTLDFYRPILGEIPEQIELPF